MRGVGSSPGSAVWSSVFSKTVAPLWTMETMFVWLPRMVTVQVSVSVVTVAARKMVESMPERVTLIFPWSTRAWAAALSASVTSARASRPFSQFPATTPRAAEKTLPTAWELGIPQVKAFLYRPEFMATATDWMGPFVRLRARAAAKAMAPGSVTPRAGIMSSWMSLVSGCMGSALLGWFWDQLSFRMVQSCWNSSSRRRRLASPWPSA